MLMLPPVAWERLQICEYSRCWLLIFCDISAPTGKVTRTFRMNRKRFWTVFKLKRWHSHPFLRSFHAASSSLRTTNNTKHAFRTHWRIPHLCRSHCCPSEAFCLRTESSNYYNATSKTWLWRPSLPDNTNTTATYQHWRYRFKFVRLSACARVRENRNLSGVQPKSTSNWQSDNSDWHVVQLAAWKEIAKKRQARVTRTTTTRRTCINNSAWQQTKIDLFRNNNNQVMPAKEEHVSPTLFICCHACCAYC